MAINNTEGNIIRYQDKLWNHYQHVLLPVYPPHVRVDPDPAVRRALMRLVKPYFIRWTTAWDCRENTGFWFIIKDRKEDIADYTSKIRNSISRGIRNFHARIIPASLLKTQGYPLYLKAFQRYQTAQAPLTEAQFRQQLEELFTEGRWEFWGLFENQSGSLVGYSMNWIYDHSCEYKTIKLDPACLKESGSYLLIHEMNKYYLNGLGFRYVNDGSRSLMHESNIQEFLEKKFLFRKAYCRLNIHYNPWVKRAVNLLYPLRNLFYPRHDGISARIGTLLKHEEIVRDMGNGI